MEEEKKEQELPNLEQTIKELREELNKALKEKEEYFAGLQRAKADFLKYQQEEEKRKEQYILLANFNIMSELINVLDSFVLALENVKDEEILKGLSLIKGQLEGILKKYGLEIIEPKEGEILNPRFHEAISRKTCQVKECQGEDEGKIVSVFARGYALHGTVIRPAQVSVIFHEK